MRNNDSSTSRDMRSRSLGNSRLTDILLRSPNPCTYSRNAEMFGSDRSRPKDYRRAVVASGQQGQRRPLAEVDGRSLSKKDLTGPTLLEMSGRRICKALG